MKLAPITVRSQAIETSPFQRQPLLKLPALPHKHQSQGSNPVVLISDFDKTLTPHSSQGYGLSEEMKYLSIQEFFDIINQRWVEGEGYIECYMKELLERANRKDLHHVLSPKSLRSMGETVEMIRGVDSFVPKLQKYSQQLGIQTKFGILSSGLEEMINGTKVAKHAEENIRGNRFEYDSDGHVVGFERLIEPKDKPTQLNEMLNGETLLAYLGDGATDIDAWEEAKNHGAKRIAVFGDDTHQKQVEGFLNKGLVDS
ncbi:MAG: hypothetical protein ACK5T0_10325, partial [Vampirovibrionales bacterium]